MNSYKSIKKTTKNNAVGLIVGLIVLVLVFLYNSDMNFSTKLDLPQQLEQCDVIVHYIDVGQGDSTFVQLPDGRSMLIDAGENDYGDTVVDYIKSSGEDYLDFVVATHPHSDHIGGMDDVIDEFDVGAFYMPDCSHNTVTFESMLDSLSEKEIKPVKAESGVVICNDDNLRIEILSPVTTYDDLNNYSAVVKLTYGNKSFLFMGDAEQYAENLISADVSADVIKVGHHGSSTSTGEEFFNRVNPTFAVISSGENNDYGHPHKEVLDRLKESNIKIFRTDTDGTVVIGTDGENLFY